MFDVDRKKKYLDATVQVCKVGDELKERLKKFRFRKDKTNAAIFLKCHKEEGVIIEEEFEDCTIEDLQAELCEHVPRFVVLSYVYKHDDGRVSYPLCFIFSSPQGSKPELQMLYAGSVQDVIQQLGITKTFDIRSTEELTEEWLLKKLEFFR